MKGGGLDHSKLSVGRRRCFSSCPSHPDSSVRKGSGVGGTGEEGPPAREKATGKAVAMETGL